MLGYGSARNQHLYIIPPDLVIADTKMPGGNIFDLMSKMRRGEVGDNPFVPVIMLIWDANADVIRNALAWRGRYSGGADSAG